MKIGSNWGANEGRDCLDRRRAARWASHRRRPVDCAIRPAPQRGAGRRGRFDPAQRRGLPPTLSPIPLDRGRDRGADPAAAAQHLLRRQELSRARPRIRHAAASTPAPRQGAVPRAPIIFSKVPESVVADRGSAVIIDPDVSPAVDYEAELAVIIGKGGRGISQRRTPSTTSGATPSSTT